MVQSFKLQASGYLDQVASAGREAASRKRQAIATIKRYKKL